MGSFSCFHLAIVDKLIVTDEYQDLDVMVFVLGVVGCMYVCAFQLARQQ